MLNPIEDAVNDARLAFTSGGMQVRTAQGTERSVPAGPCYIMTPAALTQPCTVRWEEAGATRTAVITQEALRGYLSGCIVQYA